MKRTIILLSLTLGLPALSTSAQSQGDQGRQLMKGPAPDEERDAQVRERPDNPQPERRREMLRRHRLAMQRRNWQTPHDFDGPPPRFGQGRPEFAPPMQGRRFGPTRRGFDGPANPPPPEREAVRP